MLRTPKVISDIDSGRGSLQGKGIEFFNGTHSGPPPSGASLRSSLAAPGTTDPALHKPEPSSLNRILGSLPPAEFARLKPYLQRVVLHRGQVLFNVADPVDSVYFPLAGMVGLLAVMDDGRSVVLAPTARDGFVGVPTILGATRSPMRAAVLIKGTALKLGRDELQRILPAAPQFVDALRAYCMRYLTQVVQIGACHALHTVQQRVACWLLIARNRSEADSLPLTHESVSELLGCRRSSVTEVLSQLEATGIISGSRGHISISDPERLAGQACQCYAALSSYTMLT